MNEMEKYNMEKEVEVKEKKHIKIAGITLWRIVAYFIIYSVAGFIIETIFGVLTKGVLESRKSFLYGPFCSIYGLGAVLMILPLQRFKKNNYTLFAAGFVIGSIIEYLVVEWFGGHLVEKIYHEKWWDYSDQILNLNGRICVLFSLFWGLLAIYLMSDINKRVDKLIDFLKKKISMGILKTAVVLVSIFLAFDLGITAYALQMFTIRIVHDNNLNVANKQYIDEQYEKIYVKDTKQKEFILKYFDDEKMIKTFPNIKIEDVDGNILFYRKYVKDIKPYYYNFRSNSHLKLKYFEDVDY